MGRQALLSLRSPVRILYAYVHLLSMKIYNAVIPLSLLLVLSLLFLMVLLVGFQVKPRISGL